MTKKKLTPNETDLASDSQNVVYTTHYEITNEPILDRSYRRLPKRAKEALERLHQKSQTKPRQSIPELQEMIGQYPDVPQFYNYLTLAYSRIGETGKAEAIVRANIQKNPDYLFARVNYAEICLIRKDYAKIPEIFDHKFDLQLLYPNRKLFHITEVVNFMGVMGLYFYAIHQRDVAEKYNKILQDIAPEYLMTKKLKRKLSPNFLVRLWNSLTGL